MEKKPMQGAPIDARVIQLPHGFKVVPPQVFKHSDDQFALLNLAGSTVQVSFPVLPTVPAIAAIPPGGTQVFNIGSAAPGPYEYLVEVVGVSDGTRSFSLRASANSDPQIIIDF
jgi:hypothetical protein